MQTFISCIVFDVYSRLNLLTQLLAFKWLIYSVNCFEVMASKSA